MFVAYFIETLNPYIIQFGHSAWGIRWYGTAYLSGFVIAYFLMSRFIKTGRMAMPRSRLPDYVIFVAIFGVLIGGRLGEAILYRPHMFTNFSPPFPYWGLLKVQYGGMAAHGGIVGVFVATWIFARRNGYAFLNLMDCSAMVAPIGLFFGRIANFINGELYGHVWHNPWAVQFPTELIYPPQTKLERTITPTQVHNLINKVTAHFADRPHIFHALQVNPRMEIVNLSRENHPYVVNLLRQILLPRIPSQLVEATTEGLLLFIICYSVGLKWKKPGIAAAAFAVGYPIMRIIGEQFRDGDQPRMIMGQLISLGIIYSVPMLIIGLVFLAWVIMRRVPEAELAKIRAYSVVNGKLPDDSVITDKQSGDSRSQSEKTSIDTAHSAGRRSVADHNTGK